MLEKGDTLKVTQTATPVQLDQVLTALQGDTRQDLKDLLDQLDVALNSKPTPAQNRDLPPMSRGQTAAESFNDAYDDIPAAERSTAQVLDAFLGIEPGRDLARLIDGTARTTGALIQDEAALQSLITNFNVTMAAFASESANLQTSVRELPGTLESANRALRVAQRGVPAHARVRARDPPGRPRDAGDDRGGVPVDPAGDSADGRGRARRPGRAAGARVTRSGAG